MSRPADSRPTDPFSGIQLLSDDAYRSLGSMEAVEWEAPAPERLRVAEIAPGQVVLILSEFGTERQVVLRQRRRQEGLP